jgi:hypothetical protein
LTFVLSTFFITGSIVFVGKFIFNRSSSQCWTGIQPPLSEEISPYDLCGQPIRHHKFPDNVTDNSLLTNHFYTDPFTKETSIRVLGVQFENIICPKDNEGNDILNIVGYEILRGSREGNKTVIAKGMLNNLRPYNIKGQGNIIRKGLYPNHPFNTIRPINPDIPIDPDNSDYQEYLNPSEAAAK